MSIQHTPGPWFSDLSFVWSESIDRYFVTCHNKDLPNGRQEAEANARLIAAAPDLLQILQRIVDRATRPVPDSTGHAMVSIREALLDEARAAIARATGEA